MTADSVDFAVGCSGIRKVGDRINAGEPLLIVHARDAASLEAAMPYIQTAVAVET